jgi:hypothetical protein
MAQPPMTPRSFKCDDPTWDGATKGAAAEGENLSEELRRFLRRRYRRYIERPVPQQTSPSEDQP